MEGGGGVGGGGAVRRARPRADGRAESEPESRFAHTGGGSKVSEHGGGMIFCLG